MIIPLTKEQCTLAGLAEGTSIDVTIQEQGKDDTAIVKKVIKDMQGDFGGDNEKQMSGLQLLKGLATSDNPLANKFMDKLDKATSAISKEMEKE